MNGHARNTRFSGAVIDAIVIGIYKYVGAYAYGGYQTKVDRHIAVVVVGIIQCAARTGFANGLSAGSQGNQRAHDHAARAAHLDAVVVAVHLVVVFVGRFARQGIGHCCAAGCEVAHWQFYIVYAGHQIAEAVETACVGNHTARSVVSSAHEAVGTGGDFDVVGSAFHTVGAGVE